MHHYPDAFEFSAAAGGGGNPSAASSICIADDVILDGKLLPFNFNPNPPNYRRCESDGSNISSAAGGKLNPERSRLRRAASVPAGPKRAPPSSKARVRPRWYWLAFWSVRAPVEMEIGDMKSRQRRRSSPAEAECGWRAWRVVRTLSCKGEESAVNVGVTAPLCQPREGRGILGT